jgi:uroporphyrinogen-III synthase
MALQSRALPILITRPEPQATRFSKVLTARYGALVQPVTCPLIAPRFLTTALPDGPFGAVVLTSETGVLAADRLAKAGHVVPSLAFCVGDRTAEVAQGLGFDARSAAGDASALIDLIQRHPQNAPFLHLHGRETRGDVVRQLRAQDLPADGAEVYAQEEQPLSAAARALLAQPGRVVVPLFSPRTADLFAKQLAEHPVSAQIFAVAISKAAAEPILDLGFEINIADHPTQESLLSAIDKVIFQT